MSNKRPRNKINPQIPSQFFCLLIFQKEISTLISKAPIERKIPIGYTQLVYFTSSLSVLSAWTQIQLVHSFPTKLSPRSKKIPRITIALITPKKNISIQIFLLSLLLNQERKYKIEPNIPTRIPSNPKRYPYGLKTLNDVGIRL